MSTDCHSQVVGRGEGAVAHAHCGAVFSGKSLSFSCCAQSGSRNHSSEGRRNHSLEAHLFGDELFGASGMRWEEVESRRQERRRERLPAQGQRLGDMCHWARDVFSGIVGRRLRHPWAQSSPKMEELGQRQLATCLGDRTQGPDKKKTPHRTESLFPQQSRRACSRQSPVAREAGLLLGYHGKCPVQESHCDVLQAEPGPVGSLTELCLHAAPGHLTSARLVAVLLGPGQGLEQHVPQGQQHVLVEKQEQLPQRTEQLVQGIRELEPLGQTGEAVTERGKVGGTVGRKEAACGTEVGSRQLQAGPHHGQQVGAPRRQRLH